MKKLITILAVLLLAVSVPAMGKYNQIETIHVIDAETIALSANTTSIVTDLDGQELSGYFSIQVLVAGDGTAKFEYQVSNNGTDYLEPTSASDIATGVLKTSGPGSDGKNIYSFTPTPANYIRIKVTETGGANSITVSVWLTIH